MAPSVPWDFFIGEFSNSLTGIIASDNFMRHTLSTETDRNL